MRRTEILETPIPGHLFHYRDYWKEEEGKGWPTYPRCRRARRRRRIGGRRLDVTGALSHREALTHSVHLVSSTAIDRN